jgi:hypothetical protein
MVVVGVRGMGDFRFWILDFGFEVWDVGCERGMCSACSQYSSN